MKQSGGDGAGDSGGTICHCQIACTVSCLWNDDAMKAFGLGWGVGKIVRSARDWRVKARVETAESAAVTKARQVVATGAGWHAPSRDVWAYHLSQNVGQPRAAASQHRSCEDGTAKQLPATWSRRGAWTCVGRCQTIR